MLEKSSLTSCKPNQMFQDKKGLGAGDSPLLSSPGARVSKAKAERAGRGAQGAGFRVELPGPGGGRGGAAGAYLLPEVDGYVGDAQGHQEPDQGPVVRERREFHHSPRRGLTPHTSAAARGLCREARGEWAERGRGRTAAGSGGASGRRRLLLAAATPSPSAAALAGDPQAQVHPCCPPTQQRSAGKKKRRDSGGGGGGSSRFC